MKTFVFLIFFSSCSVKYIDFDQAKTLSDSIHKDAILRESFNLKNKYVFYSEAPESKNSFIFYYRVQQIKYNGKISKVKYQHLIPINLKVLKEENKMFNY